MILALRRGALFTVMGTAGGGHQVPMAETRVAYDSLYDVARELGYEGSDHYNWACINRPDEVRERLAAL